jgi:hypothetical protein
MQARCTHRQYGQAVRVESPEVSPHQQGALEEGPQGEVSTLVPHCQITVANLHGKVSSKSDSATTAGLSDLRCCTYNVVTTGLHRCGSQYLLPSWYAGPLP